MAKIEGTIIIDGLIEGTIPALPGAEEKLRGWVEFAHKAGLEFILQAEGGRFTLLADNHPRPSKPLAPEPSQVIASALNEMLKTIPPAERGKVTSTLRSIEFRPRQEVQTVYPITPEGVADVQQRILNAHTQSPPPPLSVRERLRIGLFSVAAAIAVIALSAVFVDYPSLWREIHMGVTTPSADEIEVVNSVFADYFTVEKKEVTTDGKALRLLLRRTARFPRSSEDVAAAATQPTTQPMEYRLVLDALARGYIRAEYYNDKGNFQNFHSVRIQPLKQAETVEVSVPLASSARTKKIVLTY